MTQSHLTALLREIDGDIDTCRRHIVELQVEIARLQDARLTLMRREERKAYFAGQPSPFGDLNGGQIAVRDPELRMLEDGALSRAAKTGLPIAALAATDGLQRPALATPGERPAARSKAPSKPHDKPSVMRAKLLKVLADMPEGMTAWEVSNFLGLATGDEARKPVQNTLHHMRKTGLVDIKPSQPGTSLRRDAKAYFLTELGQRHAARVS